MLPETTTKGPIMTDDRGDISDGYHTFGELYAHRRALMLVLMRSHPGDSFRTRQHHPDDDPMFPGHFMIGIDSPAGPIRYHVGDAHWSLFDFAATIPHAPKWDGAGPDATVERLLKWEPNRWDCEAYGSEGSKVGVFCFFADAGSRECVTHSECSARMKVERERVHERIRELAEAGDPVGVSLLSELPSPDMLLRSAGPGEGFDGDEDDPDPDCGRDEDVRDGSDEQEPEPFRGYGNDPLG